MKLSFRWLAVPVLTTLIYLIIRLVDQSQMIWIFPIDQFANDYSSHLANLYFLKTYGFHATIPNWYDGTYVLFKYYPFLWHFFALPFYLITNNLQLAAFSSLVAMYSIGLALTYKLGIIINISRIKRLAFFAFFFANPIAIGVFLRLGKLPEMFGWLVFLALACLVYSYKTKDELDWKFYLALIAILSALFYSHSLVFITSFVFVAGFFIFRILNHNYKSILFGAASLGAVAGLTSFLWRNMLTASNPAKYHITQSFVPLQWLLDNSIATRNDRMVGFIMPIIFLVIFVLFLKSKNFDAQELKFYLFPAIFAVLYLTRLPAYIPIINRSAPDMYHMLFLFYSLILLLSIDLTKLWASLSKFLLLTVFILPLMGIGISIVETPWFMQHNLSVKETINLLDDVDGKLVILNAPSGVSRFGIYSYGAIYKNITTTQGWSPIGITNEQATKRNSLATCASSQNCTCLSDALRKLDITNVIFYGKDCTPFSTCLNVKSAGTTACLMKLPA